MEPGDNTPLGKLVYVCGKSYSSTMSECFSLKGKLVADLSMTCFVRTHACPVADLIDAYCAIAASHAFIFVLNEKTLYDPDCLNQLGVAILYNIPVIAVQIEGFELPKPLPLRFYETRFVDKRANASSSKKDTTQNDIPLTLAGVILGCFENSIICKATSYVSFLREVVRVLSTVNNITGGNKNPDMLPSDEEGATNNEVKSNQVRHARSGLGSSRTSRKTLRNGNTSSAVHKQKGLQSIYGADQKFHNRQPLLNRFAYKKIDLNLSTVPGSLNRNGKRPPKIIGRQAFQREHASNSAKGKENRARSNEHSFSNSSTNSVVQRGNMLIATSSISQVDVVEITKSTSSSSLNLSMQPAKSENELLVPVVGPKGQKLRRYSSLPVVPTQYLVASEKKSGSPQIMSFPPPSSKRSLTPRSDSPYFFNDELEFDPIHISRTCTPVDTFDVTSRSDSPEESSR